MSFPQSQTSTDLYSFTPETRYINRTTTFSEYILVPAFERFKQGLQHSFVPWKFHPKGAIFEPAADAKKQYIKTITIEQTTKKTTAAVDESYSLTVSANGSVLIQTASTIGGIYAFDTLAQLFYAQSNATGRNVTSGVYTPLAPVFIHDTPFYEHRGLLVDISRNWFSPKHILHTMDAMVFSKLNRLHLHASDAQSWPLEIPALPELATKGAYQPGLTWSVAELAEVQAYAADVGVEIIVEIDSPGHTASIAYAYPDLIAAFNEQPWSVYANEPPSGQLKLNSPAVYTFFDKLYADLLPRISPFSAYFHTGGDELNTQVYALDPTINSNDSQVIKPYLQAFINHIHGAIRAQNLTPIVWEEMLLVSNLSLPTKDTIIQIWKQASLLPTLESGHKAIFGDSDHWYLDCGHGGFIDPVTRDPTTSIIPPYADWCGPMKNWREIYSYDPTVNITSSLHHLIIGGEIQIWSELTDPVNFDGKVWPRAAAAAEILWSGPKGLHGVNEGVTRRLAEFRERLVQRGFSPSMVQMEWCLQNEEQCTA